MRSEPISDLTRLTSLEREWDELAVATRTPLMSPACVIAWWHHLAPPGAQLRAIAVWDAEQLVGLAPFYTVISDRFGRIDCRLPGIEIGGRLAPLAAPEHVEQVAHAIAETLAKCDSQPAIVSLEGMPYDAMWPNALSAHWPGRTLSWQYQVLASPIVTLSDESFDAWLSGKSANFRSQMRRMRRKFAAAEGTVRESDRGTLKDDVATLMRLHEKRWHGRGQSDLLAHGSGIANAICDLGFKLLDERGRFRLQMLEIGGEPISAQLFLAAGGRVLYVNGGWDERFAQLRPAMLSILLSIEQAFANGDPVIDLGMVDQAYKLRFADSNEPLAWTMILPYGSRLPLTLLSIGPSAAWLATRTMVKAHVSSDQADRYRRLRQRLSSIR